MATPNPEPTSKTDSDRETNSPSGQETKAADSDSSSSKEDLPRDDQPKAKPKPISIDPSGSKSPSLITFHHISPDFVNYINIGSLYTYLNRHDLLTREQDGILSLTTISDIEKINRLISWLPQKGPNFLDKFIECLRDSAASDKGTNSHGELADLLVSTQSEVEKKLGKRIETEVHVLETADDTGGLNYRVDAEPPPDREECIPARKGSSWQKYWCVRCSVLISFTVVTLLLAVVIFVPLALLPQFNKNDIRPPSAQIGMTVELSFGVSHELLAEGSLGIDDGCIGNLYIISGMQCYDLYDEYTSNSTITDRGITFNLLYYWLLPGSYIEYTLAPNAFIEVWLFADESFYHALSECNDIRSYECSEYPLICHQFHNPLELPANRTIQINESGNYFQCLNAQPSQIPDVTLYDRSYDITRINQSENPIKINREDTLKSFSFQNRFLQFSPSCVLFYVDDCLEGGRTGEFRGSVSKRTDIVFFGGILLLVIIIVFAKCMHV